MKAEGHTPLCDDYVSFETAKLLKEKGFDVPTERFYTENGRTLSGAYSYNWNDDEGDCSRPSLWLAMKWLREVHKLYCDIRVGDGDFVIDIISLKDGEFGCEAAEPESCVYPTYEEAAEAAIKDCLENLI